MKKRIAAIIAVASALSFGTLLTANAEEKTISHVSLTISWDKAPTGGQTVGNIYASTTSSEFKVEGATYLEQDDAWEQRTTPTAEIELSAASGYCFKDGGKSYFTLSGHNAQYKSAELESDGTGMTLIITLPQINGQLPKTGALGWNGNEAMWDLVGGASRYEVRLYKDNVLLATVSTDAESYDFSNYINNEGSYFFMVRATNAFSSQNSSWSDRSELKTLTREDAWDSDGGTWQQIGAKWRYVYPNNLYPTNAWRFINDNWYYFDADGYMVTNAYVRNAASKTYYWLGQDGIWDSQWDTATPNSGAKVIK